MICRRFEFQTARSSCELETPSETIPNMQKCIIDRLLQWDGAQSFHGAITEVQSDLRRGLLLSPREVEVKLAVNGRVSI